MDTAGLDAPALRLNVLVLSEHALAEVGPKLVARVLRAQLRAESLPGGVELGGVEEVKNGQGVEGGEQAEVVGST
jgi:hypothetical protein